MRFKITNRRKFNRFIFLTLMITILSVFAFSTINNNSVVEGRAEFNESIIVKSGDNIWSIAKDIDSPRDIREVIYDIKELNNLDSSTIYPGEKLYLPSY